MNDDRVIRFEQSRNLRYQSMLEALQGRLRAAAGGVDRAASREWVAKGRDTAGTVPHGALIGRVSLTRSDPLAGRDFYIGPRHVDRDGILVFSWAADVAATFFDPSGSAHELTALVKARRTFDVRDLHVIHFEDDFRGGRQARDEVFPLMSALEIKKPPAAAKKEPRGAIRPTSFPFRRPVKGFTPPLAPVVPSTTPQPDIRLRAARKPGEARQIRARNTVVRSLEAPRSERMSSVLATLQGEQFEAVREPTDRLWIFEGGPGTGKTVIAVHRACYLVDEAREGDALRDVLIVGPTTGYQRHVSGVVGDLDVAGRVHVASVTSLLMELAGMTKEPEGSFARDLYEVERERWDDCRILAEDLKARAATITTKTVYEALRDRGAQLGCDPSCRSLPPFAKASTWLRYLPLLAAAGIAANGVSKRWAHVIVDEAQDVRPLEWAILERSLGDNATFSVFGDLSQRRHHTGYVSWQNLVDDLRRDLPELRATRRKMTRSYRSTQQILDYAHRLLPKGRQQEKALRLDGAPVIVDRADDAGRAIQTAINHIERLTSDHPGGSTALITVDHLAANAALRKRGHTISDWRHHEWRTPAGERLYLLKPTHARGLEFDGVVVLEPGDIPHSVFDGTLYTTLTRANKELRVVHSKALPLELRRR